MTDEDLKEVVSAGRMTAVVAANNDAFRDNAKALSLTDALNDDIAALDMSSASAISAMGLQKDGTQDKNAAEAALEKLVRKIAANGKVIKKDDETFDNTFKIPKGSFSSEVLLETARAFKNDLTPAAIAKFDAIGDKSATPVNLQAKIDAVLAEAPSKTRAEAAELRDRQRKAAVKRIKANRRLLKPIGENILAELGDAGLIAEWNSACKIEKHKPTPEPPTPPNP